MMTYEEKLKELAERDPTIVVMTSENRAAIRNLPQALGKRFIDVGIAEQTMIGAAAGLALRGKTPVVHSLATFLTLRAFEFIRTDIGIANLPVKLVGGVPGFLSEAKRSDASGARRCIAHARHPKYECFLSRGSGRACCRASAYHPG